MKTLFYIADAVIMSTMALMWALMYIVPRTWFLIPVFIPLFIIINIMPSTESFKYKKNVRLVPTCWIRFCLPPLSRREYF